MNVTEKDALTKRCPFRDYRAWSENCIASGCMAWTWGQDIVEEVGEQILPTGELPEGKVQPTIPIYEEEYWLSRPTASSGFTKWTRRIRHRAGYCGVTHP